MTVGRPTKRKQGKVKTRRGRVKGASGGGPHNPPGVSKQNRRDAEKNGDLFPGTGKSGGVFVLGGKKNQLYLKKKKKMRGKERDKV